MYVHCLTKTMLCWIVKRRYWLGNAFDCMYPCNNQTTINSNIPIGIFPKTIQTDDFYNYMCTCFAGSYCMKDKCINIRCLVLWHFKLVLANIYRLYGSKIYLSQYQPQVSIVENTQTLIPTILSSYYNCSE